MNVVVVLILGVVFGECGDVIVDVWFGIKDCVGC